MMRSETCTSNARRSVFAWGAAFLLATTCLVPQAAEQLKYKVLIQVSDDSVERLMTALNAAKFIQGEYGAPNVAVSIVVFGSGVQTLKYYAPMPVADRVRQAKANGVRVVICDYSLRAAKLRPSDMLPEVSFVRSGVAEIIEKQQQGWVYFQP
jgi:intracellular sulfur oxidation DsrE/DsrF family protein